MYSKDQAGHGKGDGAVALVHPLSMEREIALLFRQYAGSPCERLEALPPSGSARRYYRLFLEGRSYVAVYHENTRENALFINFSRHFKARGLRVPEIHAVGRDGRVYLQEDLGRVTLLDAVEREREMLSPGTLALYRQTLEELARFQVLGDEGLDYSACVPRPLFDKACVMWDLNYYKYCFLRLAGVAIDEQRLEEDFERLATRIDAGEKNSFLYRDFQSRNIMVRAGLVYFIDYQGGRRGALPYDVASLLYDAIVGIPDVQREELLDYYLSRLSRYREVGDFRSCYYHFALVRLLQAMGAFGLRGLHERKQHFLDSIHPGLRAILSLFTPGKLAGAYPEIERTARAASRQYSDDGCWN
jgi:aminoglycoside/choline kinase family phosphotransferase